ncbi:MAG TPA: hypothetical protein VFP72_03445, partial [Kineosporiaceae bacterium]|nr:hypothetical protein [Kineosporiaceae bacterium]
MTGGDRNDARSASPGWTVPVDPSPPPAGASDQGQRILERLRQALYAVTAGEFRNQETRHDLDSRLGRELLYLIANDEWVQATTEFIDLQQAGTVHTTVRVEVNLDRIAHEALREQRDQLWLPLLVLPPYRRVDGAGRRPGGTVPVVTDAGEVRPTLPQAQLRRWVSAALAEIMLDGGAEWALPGPHRAVCREERILLGMAIRRFLRGQAPGGDPRGATVPGTGRTARPGPPRTAVAGPGLPDADPAMTTRLE